MLSPEAKRARRAVSAANRKAKKFERKAKEAQRDAENQAASERAYFKKALSSELTTPVPPRKMLLLNKMPLKVGDRVRVTEDYAPGMKSAGGEAFVEEVSTSGVSVKYIIDSTTRRESNIPWKRLTPLPAYDDVDRAKKRKRPSRDVNKPLKKQKQAPQPAAFKPTAFADKLTLLLKQNIKGSRRQGNNSRSHLNAFEKLSITFDYEIMGVLHKDEVKTQPKFSSKWIFVLKRLANIWGVAPKTIKRVVRATRSRSWGLEDKEIVSRDTRTSTVITDKSKMLSYFTPLQIYMKEREAAEGQGKRRWELDILRRQWKEDFMKLSWEEVDILEMKQRAAIEKFPLVESALLYHINRFPNITFEDLEIKIGHWCSKSTIQRWWTSTTTYVYLMQRWVPLLSNAQRRGQVLFAQRFLNRWDQSWKRGQKFLLVHFDEKWFYANAIRPGAKLDRARGLYQGRYRRTKNSHHIDAVMILAFVGFAFNDHILNGGEGVKVGMVRCARAHTAKKAVYKAVYDDDGKRTHPKIEENLVRAKGDIYFKDANVTATNVGTPSEPKFDLLTFFTAYLFPRLRELVGPDGPYKGHQLILQGDNAPTHADEAFIKEMKRVCEAEGWLWEPQGAHMPHANVLDLAVFPSWSKSHFAEAAELVGRSTMSKTQIMSCVEKSWKEMPSAKIARSFVQVYKTMEKVVANGGDTTFLADGSFHYNVREEYVNTDTGVKPHPYYLRKVKNTIKKIIKKK